MFDVESVLKKCFKFKNKGSRSWGDYVESHLKYGYDTFVKDVVYKFVETQEFRDLVPNGVSSGRDTSYYSVEGCKKYCPGFDFEAALQKQWEIHKVQLEEIQRQRIKSNVVRLKAQFKKQEYGVTHYSDLLQIIVQKLFPSMEVKGYGVSSSALMQARQDLETAVVCWKSVHGSSPWRMLLERLKDWNNPGCVSLCISRCDRDDLLYVLKLGGKCSELAKLRLEMEGNLK